MENNKEKIKEELKETIDRFYKEYPNLPPSYITDVELDALLDVVEAHFLVHTIMDQYQHALNIIIRRALYFSQVNGAEEFNIDHLVRALCDLHVFNIPSDEIKAMQEEVTEEVIKYHK